VIPDILFTISGILLLYFGAELLVRGSVSISHKMNIPPLLIGLIVIGLGTSSPELVVSIDAALSGSGEIAVGNVVGSNISNIALILGLAALIYPITVQKSLLKLEVPVLVLASLLVTILIFNGMLTRINGVVLIFGLTAYLIVTIRSNSAPLFDDSEIIQGAKPGSTTMKTRYMLVKIVGGLGMLILGAELMISGSLGLARTFGLSEAVIGLTVVAVGTSAPELATGLIAAVRKQGDLILGSLIGSNILNLLFVLGVTAIIRPVTLTDITMTDLLLMTTLSVILVPIMWTGFRVIRWEGALLVLCYAGYVGYLFMR